MIEIVYRILGVLKGAFFVLWGQLGEAKKVTKKSQGCR
jgi:hypothetical protein